PKLKQTINLVPSLTMQIGSYIKGEFNDKIQRLTLKNAKDLTDDDKRQILRLFFLCNFENMIKPYPRYNELFIIGQNPETALQTFDPKDWRDLQVWYNLTWFGYLSRENRAIKRLFEKGKDFSEEEKKIVIDLHLDVLGSIQRQMTILQNLGQLELSCTPMYHPILPLLCDSKSAKEALPDYPLPEKIYQYPEDAEAQIKNSLKFYKENYHFVPEGMWPSEGSLSNQVLELMFESGIKWAASDEEVLSASLKERYDPLMKYFPVKYKSAKGDITLFFRDHNLSDAIGFVYSRWDQHDAARDFCNRLRNIRGELINRFGEKCLDSAVVPIILDGENCWEFYFQNGIHFQRELFRILSTSDDLTTVTFSEAAKPEGKNYFEPVKHIRAGSWINANFKIWIGHEEELAAWTMLAKVRSKLEEMKEKISADDYKKAMEEVYIAEGSDWFWWYGDEHQAENKSDFDVLFRWHIANIYTILNLDIPPEVNIPIGSKSFKPAVVQQRGEVSPQIDGKITDSEKWIDAGYFDASSSGSAMHQVGEILHRVWFASGHNKLFFRCDITHKLQDGDFIEFKFLKPTQFSVYIKNDNVKIKSDEGIQIKHFEFAMDDIIEFALAKDSIGSEVKEYEFIVRTKTKSSEITYPRQGSIAVAIV
ncbi:MAG: glycoside hydrolase family 57 protein, partial [bacterium]